MLKIIKNLSAQLLILDKLDKKIKFKRIFFLIAKKKVLRGDHAHKKCTQAFFSVKGTFYIECTCLNGEKKKIKIKAGKNLVLVKPLNWVKVHLNKDDICGVLCDRHYEIKDYIRDYKKFNAIKNKI